MGRIVVQTFLTLDGVMQAPGGPTEDREGGFEQGGWLVPHFDEKLGELMSAWPAPEGLLLGRRTYDIFAAHWPHIPDDHEDAPIGKLFDSLPKYVGSRTRETLDWQNSTVLDDVPTEVARLRQEPGGDIQVHGSGDLLQTLIRHDLVDEYRLIIAPVLVGTGKRLFAGGTVPAGLELVESATTPSGVFVGRYRPAGRLTVGSFELPG